MISQTIASLFTDFKALLSIGICLMVLIGFIINLNAKKRICAAGKAFTSRASDQFADQQCGEVLGIDQFQSVHGLPGYLPPTLWQRVFGGGTSMELLFTQASLVFCEPTASNAVKRTAILLSEVISARTDYNNGSTLIIKASFGTIRCDTQRTLGAKPSKKILDAMLHDKKAPI